MSLTSGDIFIVHVMIPFIRILFIPIGTIQCIVVYSWLCICLYRRTYGKETDIGRARTKDWAKISFQVRFVKFYICHTSKQLQYSYLFLCWTIIPFLINLISPLFGIHLSKHKLFLFICLTADRIVMVMSLLAFKTIWATLLNLWRRHT